MMIASPTTTSAAATTMTKNAMIWPVQVAVDAREGDQRQVDRVEHQLDAHEHHDGVATHQHANGADREQRWPTAPGSSRRCHAANLRFVASSRTPGANGRTPGSGVPTSTDSRETASRRAAGLACRSSCRRTARPGRASGCGRPVRMRSRAGLLLGRACGSVALDVGQHHRTHGGTISRAEVSSKANRYLVNISSAIELTLRAVRVRAVEVDFGLMPLNATCPGPSRRAARTRCRTGRRPSAARAGSR